MVEQENQAMDPADIKKQILETLNSVNGEDKINFLVNRLVTIDIETAKARKEAKTLKEQADLAGVVRQLNDIVSLLTGHLAPKESCRTREIVEQKRSGQNETRRPLPRIKSIKEGIR